MTARWACSCFVSTRNESCEVDPVGWAVSEPTRSIEVVPGRSRRSSTSCSVGGCPPGSGRNGRRYGQSEARAGLRDGGSEARSLPHRWRPCRTSVDGSSVACTPRRAAVVTTRSPPRTGQRSGGNRRPGGAAFPRASVATAPAGGWIGRHRTPRSPPRRPSRQRGSECRRRSRRVKLREWDLLAVCGRERNRWRKSSLCCC